MIAHLDVLLGEVTGAQVAEAGALSKVAPTHPDGAVTLAHDATPRRHDRRHRPNDLLDIGVTSLATTEAHAHAKVQACAHDDPQAGEPMTADLLAASATARRAMPAGPTRFTASSRTVVVPGSDLYLRLTSTARRPPVVNRAACRPATLDRWPPEISAWR